jgi:hypothetical protein
MILPMNPHSLLQSIVIKPRPSVFTCDMGWARFYGGKKKETELTSYQ